MRIKYFGYYDTVDTLHNRMYVTSAVNKMNYLIRALNAAGIEVDVISSSYLLDKHLSFLHAEKRNIDEKNTVFYFSSISGKSVFGKCLRHVWHLLTLFCFLLRLKKNETVIVYHSLLYASIFNIVKKIKKINIILEVEEIYTDAVDYGRLSMFQKHKEYTVFKNATSYVFSTELLHSIINSENKAFIVSHGTYNVEPILVSKYNDGKIHVVYAGTFDIRKNGAEMSVKAALHLPSSYVVHICGFGNQEDTKTILSLIDEVNSISKCQVQYEGLLLGTDYIKLIQKCHIGLSTQDPVGVYNNSSFPSKVLSYMVNGLSVVSSDLKVLRISKLGEYISFYQERTPENIAEAIINTDVSNDNRRIVEQLDKEFVGNLRQLLGLYY